MNMPDNRDSRRFWNRKTRELIPYVPGEQPRGQTLIKLNTNENPFPPPPEVCEAIQGFPVQRLRLYPDPSSLQLRECIAAHFGWFPSGIFVGNGSDEILAFAFQAFFGGKQDDPAGQRSPDISRADELVAPANCLAFPDITYSFYPVFARTNQIPYRLIKLDDDFGLPLARCLEPSAGLVLANPNAPTGIAVDLSDLSQIAASDPDRLIIVDEAYVDFGAASAVSLLSRYDNLLVIQTFSKSRSLAGLRVGYALGSAGLIEGLERIRDTFNSYTMDSLAQTAAAASLSAEDWFKETRNQIMATRDKSARSLQDLGFLVLPSSANFLFARHPAFKGRDLYQRLRQAGILVRHFNLPRIDDFLRISIGTAEDMENLVEALRSIITAR
jgi:histidinol-phosphate aminotransferase